MWPLLLSTARPENGADSSNDERADGHLLFELAVADIIKRRTVAFGRRLVPLARGVRVSEFWRADNRNIGLSWGGLLAGMYAGPGRAWAGVIACSGGVGVRRGRDF